MNKIIQWNIRGARVNYCELLLLIKYSAQESYASKKLTKKTTPLSTLKTIIRTTILNSRLIDLVADHL